MIPQAVLAYGWIPFSIALLLSVVFALTYVLWYRSVLTDEQSCFATFVAVVSLSITLLTSVLVPGKKKKHVNRDWPSQTVRATLESTERNNGESLN